MAGNTFGKIFQLTTFGESHGSAIGGVLDGCPAGLKLDLNFIQSELDRRKPGQSTITSQRKESDAFEILSGVYEGITLGTPIAFLFRNEDDKPSDYENLKDVYRPSHADYVYDAKYGIRDYRGGGRSSARETGARVFAGAIAKQLLGTEKISIRAYVSQVGKIKLEKEYTELNLDKSETNMVRCPDETVAGKMIQQIEEAKKGGDTVGGVITCVIQNVPVGLGEPVFDKLHADLAKAVMSINAAHGFEYGSGFEGAAMKGSEHNDIMLAREGKNKLVTKTNHSGGILGGISNGMDICFRVAFKPVSTLMMNQQTIDSSGNAVGLKGKGRHDPCVVPRAVPIVEAMAALVLADHFFRNINSKLKT
ncbi:MAG: chorismate synthase [Bacteroidetes bacterium]|nr:chorismate synthase [Bacteroidota bacterium]